VGGPRRLQCPKCHEVTKNGPRKGLIRSHLCTNGHWTYTEEGREVSKEAFDWALDMSPRARRRGRVRRFEFFLGLSVGIRFDDRPYEPKEFVGPLLPQRPLTPCPSPTYDLFFKVEEASETRQQRKVAEREKRKYERARQKAEAIAALPQKSMKPLDLPVAVLKRRAESKEKPKPHDVQTTAVGRIYRMKG